jgi:hypothetical protein
LFRYGKGIVDLNAEVSDRAFDGRNLFALMCSMVADGPSNMPQEAQSP